MSEILATLRLQFHRDFTLDDACRWVDYYAALGISHLYASPLLASRSGSAHGYDGIDPTRIDPELGGEEALERLVKALRERGMGLILDIVPNHLAVGGSENPWWQEVLAHGPKSPYADFFDIDWHSQDPTLTGKVLLPFLGAPYEEVLHSGELVLRQDEGAWHVQYHEHQFPIDPESLDTPPDPAAFDTTRPEGARRLHELLERQHYRLAFWRTASDEINWRRFFDITELAGVRVELDKVFIRTHEKIFELVAKGWVDGLRIDHVDGLADPKGYCRRLREELDALEERRPQGVPRQVPIYLEKILAGDESLHEDWGVAGTTGYEFMNQVSALMHDPEGEAPLKTLWKEVTGRSGDFLAEVRQARGEMLEINLNSEFHGCARALSRLAKYRLETRDITLSAIERALHALVVHFPVYRTYADERGRPLQDAPFFERALQGAWRDVNPPDREVLKRLDDWLGGEAPEGCDDLGERELRLEAIQRFQQLTSPAAAKAVEDTAGYRSAVLISRNDVGGDPEHFAHSPQAFHAACRARASSFPHTMLTTATHDHKRGEDVRARLAALSEQPWLFAEQVRQWRRMAAPLREELASGLAPSSSDELMLYQILLGAWDPALDIEDAAARQTFLERLAHWQEKALREAKLRSHWLWPDSQYETACRNFLFGLLEDPALRSDLREAARALDLPGALNGLVQVTLRMTTPGVPDLYQGTEFWDHSLVDPDNRRPVDYASRQAALKERENPGAALAHWRDGRVKQALIAELLALRQRFPGLFLAGDYIPLEPKGTQARHLLAFLRVTTTATLLVVVPRLTTGLLEDEASGAAASGDASSGAAALPWVPAARWENTRLSLPGNLGQGWRSALTGEKTNFAPEGPAIGELLRAFPVGVFVQEAQQDDIAITDDREV
ncbi:malto-oligosyltrehalose synthase [Pistricoccus aurantiacus]|uniref:malto-oligosyltrehalose synthase n=1 Tax=Pistricoccus aurantiacus TaxID=1883414 RepID=UPI00363CF027